MVSLVRRSIALVVVVGALIAALPAGAVRVLYIVRHADRLDHKDPNSPINEKGLIRSYELARVLTHVKVTAAFVTDVERTQQTARPTLQSKGLVPAVLPRNDLDLLHQRLEGLAADTTTLVVQHHSNVPTVLKRLGVTGVDEILEDDYANLFLLVLDDGPKAKLLTFQRLRYGAPTP